MTRSTKPAGVRQDVGVSIIIEVLFGLLTVFLDVLPWGSGGRAARRSIREGRVRCGLRAVHGRVLNIGTEWSTGVCQISAGHLRFVPQMGILRNRDIRVISAVTVDALVDNEDQLGLMPRPLSMLRVVTLEGDLYWAIPETVEDAALDILQLTASSGESV